MNRERSTVSNFAVNNVFRKVTLSLANVTDCMQHSPPSAADSCSVSTAFYGTISSSPHSLQSAVCSYPHKMNKVQALQLRSFKISVPLPHLHPGLPSGLSPIHNSMTWKILKISICFPARDTDSTNTYTKTQTVRIPLPPQVPHPPTRVAKAHNHATSSSLLLLLPR